jgi:hypothetical protein
MKHVLDELLDKAKGADHLVLPRSVDATARHWWLYGLSSLVPVVALALVHAAGALDARVFVIILVLSGAVMGLMVLMEYLLRNLLRRRGPSVRVDFSARTMLLIQTSLLLHLTDDHALSVVSAGGSHPGASIQLNHRRAGPVATLMEVPVGSDSENRQRFLELAAVLANRLALRKVGDLAAYCDKIARH